MTDRTETNTITIKLKANTFAPVEEVAEVYCNKLLFKSTMAYSNVISLEIKSIYEYKDKLLRFIENYNRDFLNSHCTVAEILSIYNSVWQKQRDQTNNVKPISEEGFILLSLKG